ncbi:MAG: hypothetical protein QNK16_12580 [Woeseiaceae bacterium]|nr:hypothetical protein [Woeseiaceae bacterium]MDX2609211.1 hypothetical protein [Woeseiaceae bacterium]
MLDSPISRRRFIATAIAATSVLATSRSWLPGAWAASEPDPALPRLARLLFPHDAIPDSVYADVGSDLFNSFAAQEASAQLLDAAEVALDEQQESSWFDADEDVQIAALKNIQGEAFFGAILAALRGSFYYHPQVWQHLGYPGSSKEHGGYKHRGFNDIDWLPEGK